MNFLLTMISIGLLYMKRLQESYLLPEAIYIRRAIEIPNLEGIDLTLGLDARALDDADAPDSESDDNVPFRMVICMFKGASFRLHSAQYLQSDIGFKRVIRFQEFELGGLDPESRTSKSLVIYNVSTNNLPATRSDLLPHLCQSTVSSSALCYL